jgi:hypothetical protein
MKVQCNSLIIAQGVDEFDAYSLINIDNDRWWWPFAVDADPFGAFCIVLFSFDFPLKASRSVDVLNKRSRWRWRQFVTRGMTRMNDKVLYDAYAKKKENQSGLHTVSS